MARPRQVSDADILDAARRGFLAHGPALSTARIAEELGVSQAALFKRFGTKDDLLVRALAPPPRPPWIDRLADGPDDRPIPDQLRTITMELLGYFREMTPCLSILRAAGLDVKAVMRRLYEVPPPILGQQAVAGWFRRAAAAGRIRTVDPDALAFMLLGSIQSRFFIQHVAGIQFPVADPEVYVGDIVDVLWRGTAPEEGACGR